METTNVFVNTFTGLGLPPTLSFPLPSSTPISSLLETLDGYLPPLHSRVLVSTASGAILRPTSEQSISDFLGPNDDFITLRLTVPLCGGKGGFGSQLRAAGGRMSSRKRKGQENNDSCRNLDGRRMRTVKEAKALAQYLQTKPDMDEKEKKLRKERWEKVIETADDKIKGQDKTRFDDVKWLEEKDEVRDKTRDAVIRAMKASGGRVPVSLGLNSDKSSTESIPSDDEGGQSSSRSPSSDEEMSTRLKVKRPIKFAGFDEDDEFMSSDEEEDGEEEEEYEDEEDEVEDEANEKLESIREALEDVEEEDEENEDKGKGKAIAA